MRLSLLAAVLPLALATPATAQGSTGPAGARLVIDRYYAAIDRGDFRTAYYSWSRGGAASGKSYAAFRAGFARTARSRVVTSPATDQEGAAGSVFITVPVDVRATLKNGTHQHFRGQYILRRVNDVDGATLAERSWHIDSAKLVPVR